MIAILVFFAAGFDMLLLPLHGRELPSTEEAPEHLLGLNLCFYNLSPNSLLPLLHRLLICANSDRHRHLQALPVLPSAQCHVLLPLFDYPHEIPESVNLLSLALLEPAVDREVLVEFVPAK